MKTIKLLFYVNILLGLSALTQISSIIGFTISENETLFEAHKINGYILVILIIVHVFLNRNWIIANFFRKK